jgi:hypothetical protein
MVWKDLQEWEMVPDDVQLVRDLTAEIIEGEWDGYPLMALMEACAERLNATIVMTTALGEKKKVAGVLTKSDLKPGDRVAIVAPGQWSWDGQECIVVKCNPVKARLRGDGGRRDGQNITARYSSLRLL